MPRTQIYVGNLDRDISRRDIENTFDKYGKILSCDIKSKGNAPSYAFIDFEDERDAEVSTVQVFFVFIFFFSF